MTARLAIPFAEACTGSLSKGNISEWASTGSAPAGLSCPSATAPPIAARADKATQSSRRFRFFMRTYYAVRTKSVINYFVGLLQHCGCSLMRYPERDASDRLSRPPRLLQRDSHRARGGAAPRLR